jgi:lipopolysaccharide export system protein LptC
MLFRIFTLLAVAALGLSTWILSNPARTPLEPKPDERAGTPGYYLKNAVLTDYDAAGNPSLRLTAEHIDQIDHGTEVELYYVRADYDSPDNQAWVIVGNEAHVLPGGNIVDLSGDVRLQGLEDGPEGPAVVRSDTMSYDVSEAVASTKSDVRITLGLHSLNARGLSANLKDHTVRLESRVSGHFLP